jgi:glycosyltransferase involved in cell wall biosynthesis
MARPQVLFVTEHYPTPDQPATAVFVREHARAAALHADVTVIHLRRERGRTVPSVERGDGEPPVWRVRYRRFGPPLSYIAFLVGALRALRSARRDGFRPDVIHAHSHLSALPALVIGLLNRKPVVYTEHWSAFLPDNPAELSQPMRRLARAVLARSDLVLPVSDAMRRALAALAPTARFRIVPNVVDEDAFHTAEREGHGPPARLLTAGLLGENGAKGVDFLLSAVALVRSERDLRLDVVGDGPRRAEYEDLARTLGVADIVQFHGFLLKPELGELMRQADLFVLASRFENNPCVVMEAMACGLPVVATRVGGLPELIRPDNGLLAEPFDPESIAAKITEALDGLGRFDRASIARGAVERFGREHVGTELRRAYESLSAAP